LGMAEEEVAALHEKERLQASRLAEYDIKEEDFRREITMVQQLYDGIVKRLQDVDLAKDKVGYDTQLITAPEPGPRVSPQLSVALGIALFCGLLLGGALAWLGERTDKRFRTPAEIRQRLGLPVLGYVPAVRVGRVTRRGGAAALDPMLCTI